MIETIENLPEIRAEVARHMPTHLKLSDKSWKVINIKILNNLLLKDMLDAESTARAKKAIYNLQCQL